MSRTTPSAAGTVLNDDLKKGEDTMLGWVLMHCAGGHMQSAGTMQDGALTHMRKNMRATRDKQPRTMPGMVLGSTF